MSKKKSFRSVAALLLMVATSWMSSLSALSADMNIIPIPVEVEMQRGVYTLPRQLSISVNDQEATAVAEYLGAKLKLATGRDVYMSKGKGDITMTVKPSLKMPEEGYRLQVTSKGVSMTAKTPRGAFYAVQSFLQLLPPQIESADRVDGVRWEAPCCNIVDYPRFGYRGFHLDPCRHFITVENVKKQLDMMAMLKVNTLHFHLTDDQGWRIEIKKYPRLTSVGGTRIEGEGFAYSGYYTQDEIKEIVDYAAKRFITVIPELEIPGHGMAAIAAYPELSCKGEPCSPRIAWGIEDVVMCPGKETMFAFLEDVVREMVPLFPGLYFHIGGDECPKESWKNCPACQRRIQEEHLQSDGRHTAEERLQSYVVKRMEKVLSQYGKKIIGWDEILEGGLSENATVMSWRGTQGGIDAALQKRDVIMTPSSEGLYLDYYQGDPKIEPVTIASHPNYLSKTYAFEPIPDTLRALGLDKYILGVQCNNWSEYMYSNAKMEYMMYPRALALSEIAWSPASRKDFADFSRRVETNSVRLDEHRIIYHIPLPEQPYGSCDKVVITKDTAITFQTSRPMRMVYTLDGTSPTPASPTYSEPIPVSGNGIIKIASVLSTGKMSRVRTIEVEKQSYAPATLVDHPQPGLLMHRAHGYYLNVDELCWTDSLWQTSVISNLNEMKVEQAEDVQTLHGKRAYAAVAEGYINIPEDGVYYISSRNNQLWIDNRLAIDHCGEVMVGSRGDTSMALAKGMHHVKVVFLANIIGGYPSWWSDLDIEMRKDDRRQFTKVSEGQWFHSATQNEDAL